MLKKKKFGLNNFEKNEIQTPPHQVTINNCPTLNNIPYLNRHLNTFGAFSYVVLIKHERNFKSPISLLYLLKIIYYFHSK